MWRFLQTLLLCSVLTGPQMQVSADILREPGFFSPTPIDSKSGSFILPRASGLVFLDRSIINISIAADFDAAAIVIYQRGKNEVDRTPDTNYVTIYTRQVSWAPLNISSEDSTFPNEYVFRCFDLTKWQQDVYGNYTHPESFWSPVFKITNDPAAVVEQSVSISSSIQTSTSSQRVPDSTSTRAFESESASANNAQVPTGGLSSTAKRDIALAVSLTLGGAAILGVVLFLLRRRHQKRKAAKLSPATSVSSVQQPVAQSHSYHAVPGKMQESKRTSEMPSELSAEARVPRVEDLDELVTARRK